MGDVFFGLAHFAINHEFEDGLDGFLLECHFGQETAARLAHLELMMIMSGVRGAMRGTVQPAFSKFDRESADKHFRRMASEMNEPSYARCLQEAVHGA
jgi:hypothetical protein